MLPRASPVILRGLALPSGCHWHSVQMQLQLLGPRAVSSPAACLLWGPWARLAGRPWVMMSRQQTAACLQLDVGTWVCAEVQLMAAKKIKRKREISFWFVNSGKGIWKTWVEGKYRIPQRHTASYLGCLRSLFYISGYISQCWEMWRI